MCIHPVCAGQLAHRWRAELCLANPCWLVRHTSAGTGPGLQSLHSAALSTPRLPSKTAGATAADARPMWHMPSWQGSLGCNVRCSSVSSKEYLSASPCPTSSHLLPCTCGRPKRAPRWQPAALHTRLLIPQRSGARRRRPCGSESSYHRPKAQRGTMEGSHSLRQAALVSRVSFEPLSMLDQQNGLTRDGSGVSAQSDSEFEAWRVRSAVAAQGQRMWPSLPLAAAAGCLPAEAPACSLGSEESEACRACDSGSTTVHAAATHA